MIQEDRFFKLNDDGSTPNNLGVTDKIVTEDGTQEVKGVTINKTRDGNGQLRVVSSDYQLEMWDDSLTPSNFTGTYLETDRSANTTLTEEAQNAFVDAGSLITSGPADTEITKFDMPDNYIYFYHLDQFIMLPLYADSVQDTMSVNFETSTPLSRSAPIYSYRNSGPRTVQVSFQLHRDLMTDINYQKSNVHIGPELSDDYVDILIRYIEAAALPTYNATNKMVNPPIVALRLGQDIFIKGVVNGSVGKTFRFPILRNGKYAVVDISFAVSEIEPYDAWDVTVYGSYRGIDTTLDKRLRM